MRNKTFISSMVGIAAAVAVAGPANAAVSLFDFTTGVSSNSSGSVSGSNPFNTWATDQETRSSTTSATLTGGAITIANEAHPTGARPVGFFSVGADAAVDLSGVTSIDFNVTAYTGSATSWVLTVFDEDFSGSSVTLSSISTIGTKSFSTAGMVAYVDFSRVTAVLLRASTQGSAPYGAASFTFDGMTAVGAVPAPGALALLGAAGLVGARRRRA